MSDYGEPWQERSFNDGVYVIRSGDHHRIGQLREMLFSRRQRILSCVNACAGLENPSDNIELLKRIKAQLKIHPKVRLLLALTPDGTIDVIDILGEYDE